MAPAQIKNSFNSIGEVEASLSPSTLVLKICVTSNAVRYFVLSQTHGQVIFFGDYTLHHVANANDLAQRLEKIFEKDEILQLLFSKVLLGVDEKYSLVPNEFSFTINKTEQLVQSCGNAQLVFELAAPLLQVLRKLFPASEVLHLNSTYFQLLSEYLVDSTEKLFVNVSQSHLDIIRFNEAKELQLMNRYDYQAASDFIYFVLLCCEDLKIDREKTELILIGEVDIQSKIYDLCYRYFRHINFIQKPEAVHFSKAFDVFPKHLHFNLYNLTA